MTIEGIIQNGVVVLPAGLPMPEGAKVSVTFAAQEPAPSLATPQKDRMSPEERQRVIGIIKRIAALPNENPGDTFSGVDHDQALYGEP